MRILLLSTYPIGNATHGGQLRVKNLVSTYRNAGFDVQLIGISGGEQYESDENFLSFPSRDKLEEILPNCFLMEDYVLGKLSAIGPYYEELLAKVERSPSIIQIEHPWLFPFAERARREVFPNAKLIYSSHNIEAPLKYSILSNYFSQLHSSSSEKLVADLERIVIKSADATLCVSNEDKVELSKFTSRPIAVFPNGVQPWKASESALDEAVRLSHGKRFALYCASGHPPNVKGFFDMLGGSCGSIRPDEVLIVAGSAGTSIAHDNRIGNTANLQPRLIAPGVVSVEIIHALLDLCHCIILPITQGGGTNLKTAEAISSGKRVVATTLAFRGFEDFIGDEGISIANTASDFKRQLRLTLASPPLSLSEADVLKRKEVLWSSTLKGLPDFIANI